MFDLNKAISSWRMGLSERQTCEKSDIDELETHLREEIDSLTASKLSEQEAFLVATHRLGDPDSLAAEFAKVNGGYILRNRFFWMAAGMLAYLLAKCLAGAAGNGGVLAARLGGLGAYSAGLLGAAAGALGFGIMLLLAYSVCRRNMKTLSFDRLAGDLRGKIILLTSLVVSVVILGAAQVLFSVLIQRIMSLDEVGRVMLISAYLRFAFPILLPVVLMVLLIRLRTSKLHEIEA